MMVKEIRRMAAPENAVRMSISRSGDVRKTAPIAPGNVLRVNKPFTIALERQAPPFRAIMEECWGVRAAAVGAFPVSRLLTDMGARMLKPAPIEDDNRDFVRKRVLMHATILSADGVQSVSIKDLTTSGVRISCEQRLEEGQDVVFRRGELFVAGRVAWAANGEAGVQFYRELGSAAIAGHR
jgi:hypothetical protein